LYTEALAADVHYWVSVIGTAADRGDMTRAEVANCLAGSSSLSVAAANKLIGVLIAGRKIAVKRGKVVTIA
jgi:hypothetical protein